MDYESPPVERAIRVLAHLADTPRTRLSLSEVARGAGVSKATCLRILSTLVRHGYVSESRDASSGDRSYGLGPTLIGLGRAAQSSFASVELARPHMVALSDELGVACTASAVIEGDMVVLERTGPPHAARPHHRRRPPLPLRAAQRHHVRRVGRPAHRRRLAVGRALLVHRARSRRA